MLVEISHHEKQRLEKKKYEPDHQKMKIWSEWKYCKE